MNINATLFVQAINFFIAYLLFRFILLKPAYQAIQLEQQEKDQLEERVESDKKALDDMRQLKIAQWRSCQQQCTDYIPGALQKVEIFRGIVPSVSVPTLSIQDRRIMKERISHTIASRIGED